MSALVFLFLFGALVLSAILVSSSLLFRDIQNAQANRIYWLVSGLCSLISYLLFSYGGHISATSDTNPLMLTFANALVVAGAVYHAIFMRSFNARITHSLKIGSFLFVVAFGLHYEYLRQHSHFAVRALEIAGIMIVLFGCQLHQLHHAATTRKSRQLWLVFGCTAIELLLVIGRVIAISSVDKKISVLYQMPESVFWLTFLHIVFSVITFVLMGAYWTEQITASRIQMQIENNEIRALLETQDKLVRNLLSANKSASAGALSGSLAHELNQPITAMGLNLSVLKMELDTLSTPNAALFSLWKDMTDDNDRITGIVQSLRTMFIKNNDEHIPVIDLRSAVLSMMRLIEAECDEQSIEIEWRLKGELKGKFRSTDIQQVLLNLIHNAMQSLSYSQETNRKITIAMLGRSSRIYGSVADNGQGVSKAMLPALFSIFETSKETGMGLGLWLCQYIISRYNGTIVHSVPTGGGAKFSFSLEAKR